MTISTDLASRLGEKPFAYRPATLKHEASLEIATGTVLVGVGLWRRGVLGTALAAEGGYLISCGVGYFRRPYQGRARVAVTIAKSPAEVYDFISDPQNWNRFLHAFRLNYTTENRLKLAIGGRKPFEFDSRVHITDRKSGEYIAWASDEQMLEHRGVIRFKAAPGERGTELSIAMELKAPTGAISNALASFFGRNPEQVARETLRHVKQLMETGEVPTMEGQPSGKRGLKGRALRMLYRERPVEVAVQSKLAG